MSRVRQTLQQQKGRQISPTAKPAPKQVKTVKKGK
jgi:hypothetical protein